MPCFQHFPWQPCTRLLLLPLGTANVERSFSTLNRILCTKRCRLNAEHVRHLMLLSVEGIAVDPNVCNATADNEATFNKLLDKAYTLWLQKPRRVTDEWLSLAVMCKILWDILKYFLFLFKDTFSRYFCSQSLFVDCLWMLTGQITAKHLFLSCQI